MPNCAIAQAYTLDTYYKFYMCMRLVMILKKIPLIGTLECSKVGITSSVQMTKKVVLQKSRRKNEGGKTSNTQF